MVLYTWQAESSSGETGSIGATEESSIAAGGKELALTCNVLTSDSDRSGTHLKWLKLDTPSPLTDL